MAAFRFQTRLNLIELLGRRAHTAAELLEGVREVPATSIYYHTHRFLQQHHFLSPEPPNDFAYWFTHALGLDPLGERLASVDTARFRTIKDLREKLVEILEDFLRTNGRNLCEAHEGEEFHFMSARTFVLPTPYEANDLREFREALKKVPINAISFHVFEAKLRLERGENDFAVWFESIGAGDLAREVSRLDPYTITLEGLRRSLLHMVSRHVKD